MVSCIVAACNSNSSKNPGLAFFPLPRETSVRREWLEALSLEYRSINEYVRVCELHFKSRDFGSGKRKTLKTHAIPFKKPTRKYASDSSGDEYAPIDSDSDPEIVEIKGICKRSAKAEVKRSSPPPEPMRRPSRRAAQLANEKIHNTVRQFSLTQPSTSGLELYHREPVKQEVKPKRQPPSVTITATNTGWKSVTKRSREQKEWHSIRAPVVNIDLIMDCHEELLSPVQADTLLKAQIEYNNVMKTLRQLKATNTRIICLSHDDMEPPPPLIPLTNHKGNLIPLTSTTTLTQNTSPAAAVPIHLLAVQAQLPPSITVSSQIKTK